MQQPCLLSDITVIDGVQQSTSYIQAIQANKVQGFFLFQT